MNPAVKDEIISILNKAIDTLAEREPKDISELKELSDRTIHDASILQGEDSIFVAVVIYALYKVLDRGIEHSLYKKLYTTLQGAKDLLDKNDTHNYRLQIRELLHQISSFDKRLKRYIEDVIDKAKINKSSKLFESGISLGRAAEVLGTTQWELMNYVGKTHFTEVKGLAIKKRLDFAESLFNLK